MSAEPASKRYISADELLADSFELALNILDSGFRPSFIVGVWRGGAPIGIAVQELLEVCGVPTNHIAIRTSYYTGIGERDQQVRVHGLGYLEKTLTADDRLLIVDDVHDSGYSVAELKKQIVERCAERAPAELKVATVYYKPGQSQVVEAPDYYLHTTDDWLVFPHELAGLTPEEIARKPGLERVRAKLVERYSPLQ